MSGHQLKLMLRSRGYYVAWPARALGACSCGWEWRGTVTEVRDAFRQHLYGVALRRGDARPRFDGAGA